MNAESHGIPTAALIALAEYLESLMNHAPEMAIVAGDHDHSPEVFHPSPRCGQRGYGCCCGQLDLMVLPLQH